MRSFAFVLAAALIGTSMPALAQSLSQSSGPLPHGGNYVLSPDPALGVAAVDLWFRAPGNGYDGSVPGLARIAATSAAVSKLASGKTLAEIVRGVGGRLSIDVYPDIVGISAVVPAAAARRAVAAMTAAYFAPNIDDDAVKLARRDAAVLAVEQRFSPDQTLHNALFAQLFAGNPAHVAPLPDSAAEISNVTSAQTLAFAKRAFRSDNALLAMAGSVDDSILDAVTDGSGAGSMDAPFDSQLAAQPASADIPAKVSGVGLAWAGPPIGDERTATALDFISDFLFRNDTGVVARALAEAGQTYVNGQFVTLHDPGVLLVTLEGADLDAARKRVEDAVAALQRPLAPEAFAAAREAFIYHLTAETQDPGEQADNLGWYAAEGNAAYAPGSTSGDYLRAARSLDPAFVAGVARRFLAKPVVVRLIEGAKESNS